MDYAFQAHTWYDLKILYNRQTGLHQTFINNELVSWWIDDVPLQSGDGLSLRTGNCETWYDDIRVYQSRGASEVVAVGDDPQAHIRFQNSDPISPSGLIRSVVIDDADLWSVVDSVYVNVDWTPPSGLLEVNDGSGADVDTIFSQTEASANWIAAIDPNSGLAEYVFGLGSAPGLDDVVSMTSNGLSISGAFSSLSLNWGQTYYFSVFSVNNAGLNSDTVISDGFLVYDITTLIEDDNSKIFVYPNPATDQVNLVCHSGGQTDWALTDVSGKLLKTGTSVSAVINVQLSEFDSGTYLIVVFNGEKMHVLRLLKL